MAPSCSEVGVLGVLPGVMGTLQATEVLKLLLGIGQSASGRLLCYDALALTFNILCIARAKDCPVCGDHPTIHEIALAADSCVTVSSLTASELHQNMQSSPAKYQIVDVREDAERAESRIEPSLHVPLQHILSGQAEKLPRDRTLVMYCASGMRSAQAAKYLLEHGYVDVLNLAGGILAWQNLISRR
jgi:rhodanese-related sulfurtransferase